MKNIFILSSVLLLLCGPAIAQTPDSLKNKLSREWHLKKFEQFGLVDDPTEEQKNDKIILKKDFTCTIVENGKTYSGTWTTDKIGAYVICKFSNGSVKRQYKIISIDTDKAIFEYQSPDLIRTKYHMEAQ